MNVFGLIWAELSEMMPNAFFPLWMLVSAWFSSRLRHTQKSPRFFFLNNPFKSDCVSSDFSFCNEINWVCKTRIECWWIYQWIILCRCFNFAIEVLWNMRIESSSPPLTTKHRQNDGTFVIYIDLFNYMFCQQHIETTSDNSKIMQNKSTSDAFTECQSVSVFIVASPLNQQMTFNSKYFY